MSALLRSASCFRSSRLGCRAEDATLLTIRHDRGCGHRLRHEPHGLCRARSRSQSVVPVHRPPISRSRDGWVHPAGGWNSARRARLPKRRHQQLDSWAWERNPYRVHANRSALRPAISTDGVSPETSSETSFPVIGPRLTPIMAWPEATIRFRQRRVRPTYGRPSGVHGRSPHHGAHEAKISGRNVGRYFASERVIPRIRGGLIRRSYPASSMVPPTRSDDPIGVTATLASCKIIECFGNWGGAASVRL